AFDEFCAQKAKILQNASKRAKYWDALIVILKLTNVRRSLKRFFYWPGDEQKGAKKRRAKNANHRFIVPVPLNSAIRKEVLANYEDLLRTYRILPLIRCVKMEKRDF